MCASQSIHFVFHMWKACNRLFAVLTYICNYLQVVVGSRNLAKNNPDQIKSCNFALCLEIQLHYGQIH